MKTVRAAPSVGTGDSASRVNNVGLMEEYPGATAKSEIRSSKSETNSKLKIQTTRTHAALFFRFPFGILDFHYSDLFRISSFGFRVYFSCFLNIFNIRSVIMNPPTTLMV